MTPETIPRRAFVWPILAVTALALGIGLTVAVRQWQSRGTNVSVQFREAHGLRPGAQVRHRGMTVGEVTDVALRPNGSGVTVQVRLLPEAAGMARTDTRFWVVRPSATFGSGVEGLDTLVGDQYLAILPGQDSRRAIEFVGEEEPPPPPAPNGSLKLVLRAPTQVFALRPGAEITYAGFKIGAIQQVKLKKDGTGVVAQAFVEEKYKSLVQSNTRFKPGYPLTIETPRLPVIGILRFEIQGLAGDIELVEGKEPGKRVVRDEDQFDLDLD